MSISENVSENTSNEMSGVIAAVLNEEAIVQPATVDSVREAVGGTRQNFRTGKQNHPGATRGQPGQGCWHRASADRII